MAAIAGILCENLSLVERMLNRMRHRGAAWVEIQAAPSCTVGLAGTSVEESARLTFQQQKIALDANPINRRVSARFGEEGFLLERDFLGSAPLYYGYTNEGILCFASEVKGLLEATGDIREFPAGHTFDGERFQPSAGLALEAPLQAAPQELAAELRRRLEEAIFPAIPQGKVGAWLSGGLDSSAITALVSQKVPGIHTFAAGLPGAPDLIFARQAAEYLRTTHHEIVVQIEDVIKALPEVIYFLESFDALLVRSSTLNFLATRSAADYVPVIFSGEGGDELFAGYAYLKALPLSDLPAELMDITNRLHNTALQRVDRCALASGVIPYVPFLQPDVVDLASKIPPEYKIRDGVEKWILRQAVSDLLPVEVVNRPKAKFWQGSGVEEHLAKYAESQISEAEFSRERRLSNGWELNSKEELFYYRIFRQHFGDLESLDWMGRTKGAPKT